MIRLCHHRPAVRFAHGYCVAGLWAAACILFLMGASAARAQFSGPATSSTSTYNQELTATTDRALLYPGERDVVLTIGDAISIRLFSDGKYQPQVRINNDGTVLLPLIGIVHLEGLSVTQAERPDRRETGERRDVPQPSGDPSDHGRPECGRYGRWRGSCGRSSSGHTSFARCPLRCGRSSPNREPRHYDQSSWRRKTPRGRSGNRSIA